MQASKLRQVIATAGFLSLTLVSFGAFAQSQDAELPPVNQPETAPAEPPAPAPKPRPQGCRRHTCKLWAVVDKTTQKMTVYVDGKKNVEWIVSTGWYEETPNMETHPNGRIYKAYDSKEYPGGGDYKGLGNMPYSVFVRGGVAIHGVPEHYWHWLGEPASHGCIRLHPDNARVFMHLVQMVGVRNTWITIQGTTPD